MTAIADYDTGNLRSVADAMRRMLGEEGYTDTEVREDLNGKPRMICSRLK